LIMFWCQDLLPPFILVCGFVEDLILVIKSFP
jgi:uncharacterized membrane protein YkvA (DUF1232 family)